AVAGPDALILRSDVEARGEGLTTVAEFTVEEGQQKSFTLAWYSSHLRPPRGLHPDHALTETENFWKGWVKRCTYEGPWRKEVIRSLITLKALIYAPTGGIVAAATTSLPEQLGGVRNWDYRYCWLRDAAFTLYALMQSGYSEEASAWIGWLLRAIAGDPAQMQIMYGVAGERRLIELEQKHLSGYEHSVPVRIGNAAAGQFQLDVYGEVLDALHVARSIGIRPADEAWRLQGHLVDFVEKNWDKPDDGIWEIRGPRRHFTHSKVMAWVAMDRAVKGVEQFGLEGNVEHWKSVREAIHDDICRRGYNAKRGAFTQYYGSEKLDASLLLIPLVGFLPPTDERVISTVQLIEKELMNNGFVMRYHPSDSSDVDGLPPGEGAFLPCSFWLADALTLTGQQEKAKELFNRLLTISSSLGLISEEYDAEKKRQVGNLPQAFSHVGQINTARNLSQNDGPAKHRSNS
ncbi:MAG: glycoside hydrolase family 15 protein, partial [Verrucomicrobia bacterium]|nr:glycoside hydrolase family 15 protein [Verrucomicrobiota bacterium]